MPGSHVRYTISRVAAVFAFAAGWATLGCSDAVGPSSIADRPQLPPTLLLTSAPAGVGVVGTAPSCSTYPHNSRSPIYVSTAAQLRYALDSTRAISGDLIVLQPGTYYGLFHVRTQGVTVCSATPGAAKLRWGDSTGGNNIFVHKPRVTLAGLDIAGAQGGVGAVKASYLRLQYLTVHNVGQAAIHVRSSTKHAVICNNRISYTGRYKAAYGEGVYVGTTNWQWSSLSTPDRSDSARVCHNTFGPGVTAQNVDVKEGTVGVRLDSNSFSGAGMRSDNNTGSWVFFGGNDGRIFGNYGKTTLENGFDQPKPTTLSGQRNRYWANYVDLGGAPGYGFTIRGGSTGTSVVKCAPNNSVANGKFSNVSCVP